MTDIVAFLTARLDEAEATARWSGPARIAWLTYRNDVGEVRYTTVASTHDEEHWAADGRELAIPTSVRVVWDPNCVLREVAAKRQILRYYAAAIAALEETRSAAARETPLAKAGHTIAQQRYAAAMRHAEGLELALYAMAAPYADADDYDPAWRME